MSNENDTCDEASIPNRIYPNENYIPVNDAYNTIEYNSWNYDDDESQYSPVSNTAPVYDSCGIKTDDSNSIPDIELQTYYRVNFGSYKIQYGDNDEYDADDNDQYAIAVISDKIEAKGGENSTWVANVKTTLVNKSVTWLDSIQNDDSNYLYIYNTYLVDPVYVTKYVAKYKLAFACKYSYGTDASYPGMLIAITLNAYKNPEVLYGEIGDVLSAQSLSYETKTIGVYDGTTLTTEGPAGSQYTKAYAEMTGSNLYLNFNEGESAIYDDTAKSFDRTLLSFDDEPQFNQFYYIFVEFGTYKDYTILNEDTPDTNYIIVSGQGDSADIKSYLLDPKKTLLYPNFVYGEIILTVLPSYSNSSVIMANNKGDGNLIYRMKKTDLDAVSEMTIDPYDDKDVKDNLAYIIISNNIQKSVPADIVIYPSDSEKKTLPIFYPISETNNNFSKAMSYIPHKFACSDYVLADTSDDRDLSVGIKISGSSIYTTEVNNQLVQTADQCRWGMRMGSHVRIATASLLTDNEEFKNNDVLKGNLINNLYITLSSVQAFLIAAYVNKTSQWYQGLSIPVWNLNEYSGDPGSDVMPSNLLAVDAIIIAYNRYANSWKNANLSIFASHAEYASVNTNLVNLCNWRTQVIYPIDRGENEKNTG